MTAIKHALQRDVFTPNDERLLGVVHVTKPGGGKKKKSALLCASVSTGRPVEVTISKIKKQDKSDQYKKQKIWTLKELKLVDGKETDKETLEFLLQFEKNYRWLATSVSEKYTFISCLWKLCERYLPRSQKPTFGNVPASLLEVSVTSTESHRTSSVSQDGGEPEIEDYQALTSTEESDLERMMSECELAIRDAEAFTATLAQDLSVLDGQNISSIMKSEAQVNSLMRLLDSAMGEVNAIESQMDMYEGMVSSISSQMGQMKNQESFIQITNTNHEKLLSELDKLVLQLDLSKGHIKALQEADLRTDSGIEACTSAADALQAAMQVELHQGVCRLQAVVEQQKLFDLLRQQFVKRLFTFLHDVFTKQGSEVATGGIEKHKTTLRLPKHFPYHRDLLPYKQLVLWLKLANKTKYTQLAAFYTQSLSKLYTREITDFMAAARQKFIEQEFSNSIKNLSGSSHSLAKDKKKFLGSTQSLNVKSMGKKLKKFGGSKRGLAASRESLATSDFELCDREKFSATFRDVLDELEPTCQDEEDFLTRFFHLNAETIDTLMPGGSDDEDQSGQSIEKRKSYQESQVIGEKSLRGANGRWQMMSEIFGVVEGELTSLVGFGEQLDPLNSLNMLVVIGDRVEVARKENDGSFLTKMLGNCLIEVKRNFDNFIKNKVRSVEEAHISKNKKCGVLPFVYEFEDFVELAESIFKDSNRRSDIDKAYVQFIQAVFNSVENVAVESLKTPPEVVLFENYHHLLNCLAHLKISALDQQRKEVKVRYNKNLQSYVSSFMGKPLEKLSTFIEGIEQVMNSGVRAEEVSFQLKFSKQELRKSIKEYTGKEVKKGLESLFHKVTKHTAENDNRLLRVVWQFMQDEFLGQYKHFEDIISKCYPGSGIKLEFTIEDVLRYFSEIALSQ